VVHAFHLPKTHIIANEDLTIIQEYHWGLIPSWSADNTIRKFTLNAKLETITEKPSFKPYLNNRCLIIVDGFYEWQWRDPRGKQKLKYLVKNDASELYTMGGIWSAWENPDNGELVKSYAMITHPANELMSEIHNTKQRMPLILNPYA
jgi:putative SOS response-associated peptidase YedK